MSLKCQNCNLPMTRMEAQAGKCPVCNHVVKISANLPQNDLHGVATQILGKLFGKMPMKAAKMRASL